MSIYFIFKVCNVFIFVTKNCLVNNIFIRKWWNLIDSGSLFHPILFLFTFITCRSTFGARYTLSDYNDTCCTIIILFRALRANRHNVSTHCYVHAKFLASTYLYSVSCLVSPSRHIVTYLFQAIFHSLYEMLPADASWLWDVSTNISYCDRNLRFL